MNLLTGQYRQLTLAYPATSFGKTKFIMARMGNHLSIGERRY